MKQLLTLLLATLGFLAPALAGGRQTQSLDGTWQIAFDPGNTGREAGWHRQEVFTALDTLRPITVPSCWELIEQDYEGLAFYGTRFKVPVTWKGQTVRLQFDAVNYIAEVWLNGHAIGRHEGGYGPFEFRIDDLLEFDAENFLSLRVLSPIVAQDKVIDGLGMNDAPHWRGAIAGGIWQSVRLVASGDVFVEDVFIEPRISDGSATFHLELSNAGTKAYQTMVDIRIHDPADQDTVVAEAPLALHLDPGTHRQAWTLRIPNARHWSPDDPHLYRVAVKLAGNGVASDLWTARFGMRELTIRNQQFELNGKPVYMKAAFFEGLYPTKLALPDNREMARREIQLAKDAGFNMIRPWRKPPPPMWLDLCDEMGVMVIGGLPIECMKRWPTATPQMPWRIENEVRSAILRDRNHASIVQWEIFNEIWRPELKRLKHPMSMLARELDPSRLILDESGGFADGANIYLPGQFEPQTFNDIHKYPGAPLDDDTYARFLALGRSDQEIREMGFTPNKMRNKHSIPGKMTLVSEIGYGSIPDLVDNNARFEKDGNPLTPPYRYHRMLEDSTRAALKESGLDAIYPDLRKFCLEQQEVHSAANKRMLEAIRSNPLIQGYCVHALTGGDWVLGAGLLDLWRNPKRSYFGTREANQPRYLALRVMPRNIYAGKGATITVTGINDLGDVTGTLTLELLDFDGKVVKKWSADTDLGHGVSALFSEALDTSALAGHYEARAQLTAADGALVSENSVGLDVFSKAALKAPSAAVAVYDPANKLGRFLKSKGVPFTPFDANTPVSTPVIVASSKAGKPRQETLFKHLEAFVRKGGTAVYLEALIYPPAPYWSAALPSKDILPLDLKKTHGLGLWVGVSHIVVDHPVFAGLPSNRMMGQVYEKVWAPYTLQGVSGDPIVGTISHGFHAGTSEKQNYLGPEPAWHGMDMGVVPHGEGRYILSTLRLLDNLGTDPVADKILLNLVDWTTSQP